MKKWIVGIALFLIGTIAVAEPSFDLEKGEHEIYRGDVSVYAGVSEYKEYAADIVIQDVPAYADEGMTQYIGVIPAYTAVLLDITDTYLSGYGPAELPVCKIIDYYDQACYISTDALWGEDEVRDYYECNTMAKGATLYQRPDTSAKATQLNEDADVMIVAQNDGWMIVQIDKYNDKEDVYYSQYYFARESDVTFTDSEPGIWDDIFDAAEEDDEDFWESLKQDGWTVSPDD